MLSEEDFKYKYLQHPITFLTEENLDKLETHCRKASNYEKGIEHKVVLELLERYYQYQKENEYWKNRIEKGKKDVQGLKMYEMGIVCEDLQKEIKEKDKQIDLMAKEIKERNYNFTNKNIKEIKQYFEKQAEQQRGDKDE